MAPGDRSVDYLANGLLERGVGIRVLTPVPLPVRREEGHAGRELPCGIPPDCDLLIALGGDAVLHRGRKISLASDTPMLGVSLSGGLRGELAPHSLDAVVRDVAAGSYAVHRRLAIDVTVLTEDGVTHGDWALKEVAVQRELAQHMLEVAIEIDGVLVTAFGCDGVLCATPADSTTAGFPQGGPAVWPGVEALLVAPLSAHGLFARPMVVPPDSVVAVRMQQGSRAGVLWCDGSRAATLPSGAHIEVRRSARTVPMARLSTYAATRGEEPLQRGA
jgi:NAD+ kinase